MISRVMVAGMFILVTGWNANAGEFPGRNKNALVIEPAADLTTGLPPINYPGPTCSSYREWPGPLPNIYRYCANRQNGYEAQRDDYYKSTSIRYLGSQLVDCDSTQGWKPTNGNMKSFYCP